MLLRLLISILFLGGVVADSAAQGWRQLEQPTMHHQPWGRPAVKGAKWVVPQDSGVVGVSDDGGATITYRRVGTGMRTLTHAAIIDNDVAIVVSVDGAVFRTQDGGQSWTPVSWRGGSPIRAIAATPGGGVVLVDHDNVLNISDDGGDSFHEEPSAMPSIIDHLTTSGLGDTVYAYGNQCPDILVSTDAGATWTRSTVPTAGAPRDLSVGQDGTLLLVDSRGEAWLRASTIAGWERGPEHDSGTSWIQAACLSKDRMVLLQNGDLPGAGMKLKGFINDLPIHPIAGAYPVMLEWFGDAELTCATHGTIVHGGGRAVLMYWPQVKYTPLLERTPSTILCGAVDAEWGVSEIERTPNGTALTMGWTRWLSSEWQIPYLMTGPAWISRYDDDKVEREIVTYLVLDSSGGVEGDFEIYERFAYTTSTLGVSLVYRAVSKRYMLSEDDGRTWSQPHAAPQPVGGNSPCLISKNGESQWLLGTMVAADDDPTDAIENLKVYVSKDRGGSWEQIQMPVNIPFGIRGSSVHMSAYAYAPGRVFGQSSSVPVLALDVDLEHGTPRILGQPSEKGGAIMLGGRYVVRYGRRENMSRYVETMDLRDSRIVNLYTRKQDYEHIRGYESEVTVLDDSTALFYSAYDTVFLTTNAGFSWKRYAMPRIDSNLQWDIEVMRRVRPGVYVAYVQGVGSDPNKVEAAMIVEFTPSWGPIPVSVEPVAPASLPSSPAIFPNPSWNGLVSIDLPGDLDGNLSWSIVDMLGRVVDGGMADTASGRRISTSVSLPAGLYTFLLQSRAGRRTARFVVQP